MLIGSAVSVSAFWQASSQDLLHWMGSAFPDAALPELLPPQALTEAAVTRMAIDAAHDLFVIFTFSPN
jgi:hypothetical protein